MTVIIIILFQTFRRHRKVCEDEPEETQQEIPTTSAPVVKDVYDLPSDDEAEIGGLKNLKLKGLDLPCFCRNRLTFEPISKFYPPLSSFRSWSNDGQNERAAG
jgi:hypothetical protein